MIAKAKIAKGIFLLWGAQLFSSSSLANTSVSLAWNPSSGQVAGYKVYTTLTGSSQVSTSDVGNFTNAIVNNLAGGETYSFYVKAYDANGVESDPSNTITYAAPGQQNPSQFVGSDAITRGNWKGIYGTDGQWIVGGARNIPSYLSVTSLDPQWAWSTNTTSITALYQSPTSNSRIAACWYSTNSVNFSFNVTDSQLHRVSLYLLDWSGSKRQERVDLVDLDTGGVLDSQTLSNFTYGVYLTYLVTDNVGIRVTPNSVNSVVSALFFDPMPATAARFVKIDSATQGDWNQAYGKDGSIVARDTPRNAPYATVAVSEQSEWTYDTSPSDRRALWRNDGTGRIAGVWYSYYPTTNSFYVDVNINDDAAHRLAVYALDWFNEGRAIRVDVLNAATGQVLDTRQLSSFWTGQYLVWDVKGLIRLRVSTVAGPNAMLSGIFLDPPTAPL